MDTKSKISVIVLTVASIAIMSILIDSNSVNAVDSTKKGWCETQGHSNQNWINGCQQGWSDHDKCLKYDPDGEENAFADGYKVGWNHGSCKH